MKARPTRREFLKVTGTGLAGMTVLGVVGCGGGGSQSGTLEFASFYSADDAKVIAEAIKDFEKSHSNIEIEHQATGGSGAAVYPDKLRTAMAGGEPPNFFLMWGGELAGQFIDADQALPMDEYYEKYNWADILVPSAVKFTERDGTRWGAPHAVNGITFWYRKDLFRKFGLEEVPATYAELEDLARNLKSEGIYALSMGGKFGWHVMRFLEYLIETTAGPDLHDSLNNLEASWDTPEVVEAYELLKKWVDQKWIVPGFLSVAPEDSWLPWYQGKAAMVPEVADMEYTLKADGQDTSKYDLFIPPTDHEPLRFSGFIHQLMIASESESHDASAEFINWIIQPEQAKKYAIGVTPTLGALPSAEEWPLTNKMQEFLKTHEVYLITDQALDQELADSFFAVQDNIISGSTTPQEGAKTMQQAVESWKSKNA